MWKISLWSVEHWEFCFDRNTVSGTGSRTAIATYLLRLNNVRITTYQRLHTFKHVHTTTTHDLSRPIPSCLGLRYDLPWTTHDLHRPHQRSTTVWGTVGTRSAIDRRLNMCWDCLQSLRLVLNLPTATDIFLGSIWPQRDFICSKQNPPCDPTADIKQWSSIDINVTKHRSMA